MIIVMSHQLYEPEEDSLNSSDTASLKDETLEDNETLKGRDDFAPELTRSIKTSTHETLLRVTGQEYSPKIITNPDLPIIIGQKLQP